METIEEFENNMTLFYSKQTGEIKAFATGIQTMDYFGDSKIDFEIIYEFIVLEKDEYILKNIELFKVIDNKVKLNAPINLSKYQ